MSEFQCSHAEAVAIALRAQALDRRRLRGAPAVLKHLGMVQLDTIAVLARSQELVSYARVGAVGRPTVERAYWGNGRTFEYWAHEACVLPMEDYPLFAFRRRGFRGRTDRWGADEATITRVRHALATDGPQTSTELGGARKEPGWWRWSNTKHAVEWMLAIGEVVVTERRAWKRVYDLAERAVPAMPEDGWIHDRGVYGPSDHDCVRELLRKSVRMLGIASAADLQDVYRLRAKGEPALGDDRWVLREVMHELIDDGSMVQVRMDGEPWFADPAALRRVPAHPVSVTTLLSPFDPIAWHRPRLERLFGLRMRIEAYTPKAQRQFGYFAMPVLHDGRIVGLVDPARDGDVLVARKVTLLERDETGVALALAEAARWVGSSGIRVEQASSAAAARRIAAAANAALTA